MSEIDEANVNFIGWKLDDIAEIMTEAAGFEMPFDPGWSELVNGNLLAAFLDTNHSINIAWSFAVPNPRSSHWSEMGTILVGLPIVRISLDMDSTMKIVKFHEFLLNQHNDAPQPMYVIDSDEEHVTLSGIWWNN